MNHAAITDLILNITDSQLEQLSQRLIDTLLSSQKSSAIPPGLIKAILGAAREGVLKTKNGMRLLLEASILSEREKTSMILAELGLMEASEMVKGPAQEA